MKLSRTQLIALAEIGEDVIPGSSKQTLTSLKKMGLVTSRIAVYKYEMYSLTKLGRQVKYSKIRLSYWAPRS